MPPTKRARRGQPRKKSGDNDDSDYAPPPESDEEEDEYEDDEAPPSPQPRRRGKKVPIPCNVLPEFYGNVYEVNLSGNRGEDGAVIKPDRGKLWEVTMDVLDVDEAEALLDSVPEIRKVRDLARAALAPYKEDDPDMRKVGGSGTIGLTWSLQRNRRGVPKLTQLYFFQKKLGIIVETDYCGSFRIQPVVDAFFAEDAEVYSFDLEVTQFPLTHKAEGLAWWSGVAFFGAARSYLIQQMPIGRVPSYGLTRAQRAVIDRLVEDNPSHPLRRLLSLEGGTEFAVGVSKLGKMTPEAAAAHLRLVNAGLALNGHADLVTIGEATRFTAGPGGRGSETRFTAGSEGTGATTGKATQFTTGSEGTGATTGKATQFTAGPGGRGSETRFTAGSGGTGAKFGCLFTAGPNGTGAKFGRLFTAGPNGTGAQYGFGSGEDHVSKTQAMEPWMLAKSHARNYFMLINLALHCAATDERPESWASRLLTRPKLALESLKTLEFRDSVRTGAPVEDLKIVGARVNPGRGGWERKYVFDVLREDGGVGEWASYDIAVALKLIGPRTKPPSSPGRKGYWKHLLKPWPVFSRRRKRARR